MAGGQGEGLLVVNQDSECLCSRCQALVHLPEFIERIDGRGCRRVGAAKVVLVDLVSHGVSCSRCGESQEWIVLVGVDPNRLATEPSGSQAVCERIEVTWYRYGDVGLFRWDVRIAATDILRVGWLGAVLHGSGRQRHEITVGW